MRLLFALRSKGVTDKRVLTAMETIDRAAFVDDPELAPLAFEDAMLPIPCGQVILRPAATGHLLQALALPEDGSARVLLVGFGSGYTAALLASLAASFRGDPRIAAVLDVTDPEPLPPDHPLWNLPGVLISPHVGGNTSAFLPRARRLVAEQLRRFATGQPLEHIVSR